MFVLTKIQDNELKECHLTASLEYAYRLFRLYIQKESGGKVNKEEIKQYFLQKQYKSQSMTLNIKFFAAPEKRDQERIYYQGQYIALYEYLKKINKPASALYNEAYNKNISVYQLLCIKGLIGTDPNEKPIKVYYPKKEYRELSTASRPPTKISDLTKAEGIVLKELQFSATELST